MKFLAIVLVPALLGACPQTEEPGDSESDASTSATTTPMTDGTTEPTATAPTTEPATTEPATTAVTETPATDSATDTSATDTSATDTSATTDQATDTDATDTDATDTATETEGPVLPPVQCGDVMCAEGQLCVVPGLACDYEADPPEFFQPDPFCSDVPRACQGMSEAEIGSCLGSELCPPQIWDPEYSNGTLTCPHTPDCF